MKYVSDFRDPIKIKYSQNQIYQTVEEIIAKGDRKKKLNLKKLLDNPHGIDLGPLKPLLP